MSKHRKGRAGAAMTLSELRRSLTVEEPLICRPRKILVALRDERTGVYLAPLVVATPGEAERKYEEVLKSEGTLVSRFPLDFPLYELGRYNEDTGVVEPLATGPRLLISATQLGYVAKPTVAEEAK